LFTGGLNLYAYAENDPVNFFDANGEIPIPVATAFAGGVIAFVANVAGPAVVQLDHGQRVDIGWRKALVAGGVGAVQGAVAPYGVASSRVTAGLLGAGAGAAYYALTTKSCDWNGAGFAQAGFLGFAGAFIGGPSPQVPTRPAGGMVTSLAPMRFPAAFQKPPVGFLTGITLSNVAGGALGGLPDPG
jgi:hypothetical protein